MGWNGTWKLRYNEIHLNWNLKKTDNNKWQVMKKIWYKKSNKKLKNWATP